MRFSSPVMTFSSFLRGGSISTEEDGSEHTSLGSPLFAGLSAPFFVAALRVEARTASPPPQALEILLLNASLDESYAYHTYQ